ncbi:MAG: SagB/ThcOx family dehydrogenase [Candidatus Omnitrophica bacterium]|nr:SagB/ThcOx family dehydrogenase [Candidatus Omnitrophota bacterium]MBU1995716.1 SagB/ThcOx family dehydrogenase [Candidatus Omnitrophota bacterium]MBU4333699.1 SagB/ThcOx family dehydrogenase [Candidatus Omnitrophota bacterium]
MRKLSIIFITLFAVVCSTLAGAQEPINLLEPDLKSGKLLMEALNERKSTRSFSDKQLTNEIISNLLWAAFGINREDGKRTAPSAMDFREIDIYVATQEGVYVYEPENKVLMPILNEDIREIVGIQEYTKDAPLGLIYVADYSKMGSQAIEENTKEIWASADAAFISQNVYLFCASEGLATVVIGMIDKPTLSAKLGLKDEQNIIFSQPVGYPK